MSFFLTSEQEDLRARVRAFTAQKLNPLVSDARAFFRACGEFGLLGASVPKEHGGLGLDALSAAVALEALGYACDDLGLAFSVSAQLLSVSMALVEHGSDAQKNDVLPRLCSGEWIGANAMTEAEAGSDAFALATKATRDGDAFVLAGAKSYVTNGPLADVFLVYARTRDAGAMGISAFLVPRDRVRIGAPFEKVGPGRSVTSSIYLEDARVPVSALVGREDRGASVFTHSMTWERAVLFAIYLGAQERLLEKTIEHVRSRRQFGVPLAKNQTVSHRVVEMKLRLEGARLLLYRACADLARGKASAGEIALSKIAVSEAAVQSSLDAIQLHGGAGVIEEAGIARYLHDAVPSRIFSGTTEIQKELVAAALGLHRS